jgi:hypothetical protein
MLSTSIPMPLSMLPAGRCSLGIRPGPAGVPRLLLLAGVLLATLPPVAAGTVTRESSGTRAQAEARAAASVPRGATITDMSCQTLEIGIGNTRYRCTATYESGP